MRVGNPSERLEAGRVYAGNDQVIDGHFAVVGRQHSGIASCIVGYGGAIDRDKFGFGISVSQAQCLAKAVRVRSIACP